MSIPIFEVITHLTRNSGDIITSSQNEKSNIIMSRIQDADDSTLFEQLDEAQDSIQIVKYLNCILAVSVQSTQKASSRRHQIFKSAINFLKIGKFCNQSSRQVTDLLFTNLRLLTDNQARDCVEQILENFHPKSNSSLSGHQKALELLPQLSCRAGGTCRKYALDKLQHMPKDAETVVMILSAMAELCDTEEDCIATADIISDQITWGDLHRITTTRTATISNQHSMAEELPAMVYILTSLSKKCDGAPLLKKVVIESVANVVEKLVINLEDYRISSVQVNANLVSQCISVLATIVTHLSMLISKDQGLTTEICTGIKNRSLLRGKARNHERSGGTMRDSMANDSRSISSARLLLCILAAGCSRFESKVISSLCEALSEALLADNRTHSSLWFEAPVWYAVVRVSSSQLRNAFEQLLTGCLLTEVSVGPLVTLAFTLIDQSKLSTGSTTKVRLSWSNLSSSVMLCHTKPPLASTTLGPLASTTLGPLASTTLGPSQEGIWLLTRLFELRDYSRSAIARGIVDRLHTAACSLHSFATDTSATTGSGSGLGSGMSSLEQITDSCVAILVALSTSCPHGLYAVTRDIVEIFAALPELRSEAVGCLVLSLSPLFPNSPVLADRLALALRKSCFSKEAGSRCAAVAGLMSLLRSQMTQQTLILAENPMAVGGSLSQMSQFSQSDIMVQRGLGGLSMEEILAMSRRFLQQQQTVRTSLYAHLYTLQRDFPTFRASSLLMLTNHLKSLLQRNGPDAGRRFDFHACDNEPLSDLLLTILAMSLESLPVELLPSGTNSLVSVSHAEREENLSQRSSGLSDCDELAKSSLRLLWSIVNNLTGIDLDELLEPERHHHHHYSSSSSTGSNNTTSRNTSQESQSRSTSNTTRYDVSEVEGLLVAGMVMCTSIPHSITGSKFTAFKVLCSLGKKAELWSEKISLIKGNPNKSKINTNKRKQGGDDDDVDSNNDKGDQLRRNKSNQLSATSHTKEPFKIQSHPQHHHLLLLQADFAITCLSSSHNREVVNDDATGSQSRSRVSSQIDDSRCSLLHLAIDENDYLHSLVLGIALRCLEAGLMEVTATKRVYSSSSPRNDEQRQRLLSLGNKLCVHFLTDLMVQRSVERGYKARGAPLPNEGKWKRRNASSSLFPISLSPKQLVLRGLLGCLKLIKAIGGHEVDAETLLSTVLESSFREAMSQRGATSSATGTASTQTSLAQQVKHFLALLIAMHGKDERGEERSDCPLVVAILGELTSVLSALPRNQLAGYIMKQLSEKLVDPSSQLSQALVQLFLLQIPSSSKERLHRAIEISKLLATCAAEIERVENEDEDENDINVLNTDTLPGETHAIVCQKSLPAASSCLLGVLEKLSGEIDSLQKLRIQSEGAAKSNQKISNMAAVNNNDDDNIDLLSGEEEDLEYDDNEDMDIGVSRRSGIVNIETSLAITIKLGMECLSPLLRKVGERLLSLLAKLYRCSTRLVRHFIAVNSRRESVWVLPRALVSLGDFIAKSLSPAIQQFITVIHMEGKRVGRQASIVPELIFQMEQLDLQFIRLADCGKAGGYRHQVGSWIRRSTARDFRISSDQITSAQSKIRDAMEIRNQSKRKRTTSASAPKAKTAQRDSHRQLRRQDEDEESNDENVENYNDETNVYNEMDKEGDEEEEGRREYDE